MTVYIDRSFTDMLDVAEKTFNSFNSFNSLFKFMNDREYSVPIIYEQKQKHNFSTRHWQGIVDDNKAILIYDVHGVNPNDIKIKRITDEGVSYIVVEGKTHNKVLDCDIDAGNRWIIPYKKFKKPTKEFKDGLLYIIIEADKSRTLDEEEEI